MNDSLNIITQVTKQYSKNISLNPNQAYLNPSKESYNKNKQLQKKTIQASKMKFTLFTDIYIEQVVVNFRSIEKVTELMQKYVDMMQLDTDKNYLTTNFPFLKKLWAQSSNEISHVYNNSLSNNSQMNNFSNSFNNNI